MYHACHSGFFEKSWSAAVVVVLYNTRVCVDKVGDAGATGMQKAKEFNKEHNVTGKVGPVRFGLSCMVRSD